MAVLCVLFGIAGLGIIGASLILATAAGTAIQDSNEPVARQLLGMTVIAALFGALLFGWCVFQLGAMQ